MGLHKYCKKLQKKTLLLCKRSEVESVLGMASFEVVATQLFDLQKIARKNILELVPYRCARDVS